MIKLSNTYKLSLTIHNSGLDKIITNKYQEVLSHQNKNWATSLTCLDHYAKC